MPLRINTLGIAARTIIAPRLPRFHQVHPDVVLDIVVDDALADIVVGRFDAGIRVGGRLEKDRVAVRLTSDLNMVAVASPDYLARRGIPKSPGELHDHWRYSKRCFGRISSESLLIDDACRARPCDRQCDWWCAAAVDHRAGRNLHDRRRNAVWSHLRYEDSNPRNARRLPRVICFPRTPFNSSPWPGRPTSRNAGA